MAKTNPNLPPFVSFCTASVPMVFDNSMSYYECLCALTKFIQGLVDTVNVNAELLQQLENYVKNYFDNLDVQEEINNKLDDMAQQGQLAEIIAAYLELKAVLAYDTPVALKAADNLIAGSYAKTYGYKRKDDGVYDLYTVRNKTEDDIDDGYNVIVLTEAPTLVAIRLQCGDRRVIKLKSTDNLQDYLSLDGAKEIILPAGLTLTYTDALLLNSDTTIDLNGSTINFNFDRSSIFDYDWDETLGFMGYGPDDEFTGYNGYRNITIKNGSIVGGCSAFMHNANVTFDNVYFQTGGCRHSIQLASCKNFTVKNCSFESVKDDSVENASEAINIDQCVYGAQPYISQYSVMFDDNANANVIVENNVFKQYVAEGFGYFSAVGAHGNSTTASIFCDGLTIRGNNFGAPREYAIGIKNFNNVVIEGNTLDDASATYTPNFTLKRGTLTKAVIANNVAKGVSQFFGLLNPALASKDIAITGNYIEGKDANVDSNAIFMFINIHDSTVEGNTVLYQHHAVHANTRAYWDSVEDNPNDHTTNVVIANNYFEKTVASVVYFDCRISNTNALKFANNNFVHDAALQSNWQELLLQNTNTDFICCANDTDQPLLFTATAGVTNKFSGNNAIYSQSSAISSTSTSGTFTNALTNFSKLLLCVGETANSQVVEILPYYPNGSKFDADNRVFIRSVPKNNGTYGVMTLTLSSSATGWAYEGDIPLRHIYTMD